MKIADDYEAKLDLWARDPRVAALPRPVGIPRFGAKRFDFFVALAAACGGAEWRPCAGR